MDVFRWLWNPNHYWPLGLILVLFLFLIREIWALASHRSYDTLSDYSWRQLNIVAGQTPSNWGASAYLSFGVFVVLASWLAYHIWFRKYT